MHFLYERLRWLGIPASAMLRLPSSVDPIRFQQVTKNLSADDDLWIQLLPAEALAEWRTKIAAGQPRIILYVGTLTLSHHPVDLLLQAFAQLARDREDCRLLLVGGGADLLTLQAMAQTLGIAERCCFVGRVPPAVAPYFFHVADLSVDPVHDDLAAQARWPLKIVESLAAGLPVVTGAIGDRAEMLGNGAAGRLVQPERGRIWLRRWVKSLTILYYTKQ
ncbi:MAG: glycosyltransferase [Caldilineaceae bacterium]